MEPKKNPSANLENRSVIFFLTGLLTALCFILIAFEWKTFEGRLSGLGDININIAEEEIPPLTNQPPPPPPPPPPVNVELNIVDDDEEVKEDVQIDSEADQTTMIEMVEQKVEEIVEQEIFTIVEDMPSFPGGEAALFEYLGKNIRYPQMAKDAGIQGTVYVTFVVGVDGKVRDVKVLRGIKGGCDEEAIRVVQNMPPWKPGKQRGKAVPVQYNLPIKFVLK